MQASKGAVFKPTERARRNGVRERDQLPQPAGPVPEQPDRDRASARSSSPMLFACRNAAVVPPTLDRDTGAPAGPLGTCALAAPQMRHAFERRSHVLRSSCA